jgi:hypothetical protein
MPDSVLGKIAVEIGGGTAANGGGGGSPSSSSIAGGGDSETKKQLGLLGKMRDHLGTMTKNTSGEPRFWTKALKTMGIQVGLAGILKQSQIFTSTLGSLFQILGAFVDVILAPWMPLFIPMIRKLARQIPVLKKWSENVYKQVTEVYGPWIKSMFIKMKDVFVTVKDKLIAAYDYIKKPDFFGRLVKDLSSLALGLLKDLATNGLELLKRGWNLLASNMPEWFTNMFGKLPQFTKGTTSWERRAAEEANKNGGTNGDTNGDKKPVPVVPGMVTPPSDKDDKWRPTKLPPVDYILNAAKQKVEELGDAFKNANIAEQIAMVSAASIAAAIANTTVLKSIKIAGQEVNLIRRLLPGMDIATGLTKVFGYPAQKATQLAAFAAKKAGGAAVRKTGELSLQAIEALIGRPITPGGAGGLGDEAFDAGTGMYKATREWYTNARGKTIFGIKPTGVAGGLDEMADPSLIDKVKKGVLKIPKPDVGMGIRTAGKLMQQGYGKTGEFMVETGKRIPRPAAAPIRSGMEEAIKKTRDFMSWLKGIQKSGAGAGVVKTANSKLKSLWAVFHPLLDKSPALRAVPALLTRFARYLIPMAATAFIIRETEYDIKKMMALDMPWLNDPLNIGSYMAEGKTALGQGAIREGGQSYQAQIFSGLWPGGGEQQGKRMAGAVDIIKEGQKLIDENREQTLWTGQKGQIITGRTIAAMLETGGSLFGAPGVPFIAAGAGLKEQTNRQAGIGTGSGESYFEQQFMSDMKFWLGQSTQKVTIDGADGSQYTSGAET